MNAKIHFIPSPIFNFYTCFLYVVSHGSFLCGGEMSKIWFDILLLLKTVKEVLSRCGTRGLCIGIGIWQVCAAGMCRPTASFPLFPQSVSTQTDPAMSLLSQALKLSKLSSCFVFFWSFISRASCIVLQELNDLTVVSVKWVSIMKA